jgi:ATP-dependent Lon protease
MPVKDPKAKKIVKKSQPDSDDDSSVDSKGNVRDLIDYDYEDDDDSSVPENVFLTKSTKKSKTVKEREPRKAAVVAKKRLRRIADLPSDSSDSNTTPKAKRTKNTKPALTIREATDEEDEEESEEEKPKTTNRRTPKVVIESESEEEEVKPSKKHSKAQLKSKSKHKKQVVEEEEEEEEAEYTTEESEDYEGSTDSEDEDDEEETQPNKSGRSGIDIVISDLFNGAQGRDPNKPHKYNMKKESQEVRRFVELVQKEDDGEEDTIDNDITYFKSLTPEKKSSLLQVLELKASPVEVTVPMKFKILEKVAAKPELNRIAMAKYNALCNIDPSSSEYYKVSHWITGFTNLPLAIYRDLPVKLEDGPEKCHGFMDKVHNCMETAIYGHSEAKLQIMQFVSSWIANPKANGNVLSIHGPMGVGKTTLVKNGIAKALDRPFHFITLGGATDASFLDGHSYTYEGSTWGKIVDVLQQSKCMNPILYFDELDKVSETAKGDEIMNLLIHLTDQSQNDRFQDKYFTGVDLDLSRCLFIFSHNNHEKVNPILRDRMYNIAIKGFNMKEKLVIAENYLLDEAVKDAGLYEKISISKDILQYVIENFTGGEAGVRELKRCIQTIVSKVNLLRFYNNAKQVPFAIEGFSLPFILQKKHVDLFLKKKEETDPSIAHLYT